MTIPKCANCGNEANVAIGNGYFCSWCVIQRLDAATPLTRCEHGIPEGDWCERCNKDYKQAFAENGY